MVEAGFEPQVHDTPEPVFLTTTPHRLAQMDYCLPWTSGSFHLFPELGAPGCEGPPASPPVHHGGAHTPMTPHMEAATVSAPTHPSPSGYGRDVPSPTFLSCWPGPGGLPSLRLTVDMEDDVSAVLAHCTHGHAGVAARVRGPGTGQREDPAPREDLCPQKEAHTSLCTSRVSTHTFPSWPCCRACEGSGLRTLRAPPTQGNWEWYPDLDTSDSCRAITSAPREGPLELCCS